MMSIFRPILAFCLLLAANLVHAAGSLTISTLPDPDPIVTLASRILAQAYAEMGITLRVTPMPAERSLVSANSGATDGDLGRIAGIDKKYPNLLMVPVALFEYEVVAFSRDDSLQVPNWESLRLHHWGYVRGSKIIEEKAGNLHGEPIATLQQALQMLALKRLDLVVANPISGFAMQKQLNMSQFSPLSPPLASFPVYHYLNKKHQDLLPGLTLILQRMEKSGDIARIQREVLQSF